MSIPIFGSRSTDEFKYFRLACSQLIYSIKSQTVEYVFDSAKANQTCDQILKAKKDTLQDIELNVREKLDIEQVRAMDIAQMKGASSWLSALHLDEEKFNLNKETSMDPRHGDTNFDSYSDQIIEKNKSVCKTNSLHFAVSITLIWSNE